MAAHLDDLVGVGRHEDIDVAPTAHDGFDMVGERWRIAAACFIDVYTIGLELVVGIEVVLCPGGRRSTRCGGGRERLM